MGDTLMGLTTVGVGYPIIYFTAVSPGTYNMAWVDNSVIPPVWHLTGSVTVLSGPQGPTFGFSNAIPTTIVAFSLFVTSDSSFTSPLDGFPATAWTSDPANPYILADPVLTGAPGDHLVDLNWTTPSVASADPRAELVYSVRRGTSTPPTTTIASLLLVTNYVSTGLTNGTTYYHRVAADIRIVGASTPMSVARLSNIVSNVPAVQPLVESWGVIAR